MTKKAPKKKKSPERIIRHEAISLLREFRRVIPFPLLPRPQENATARVASENGFVLVEHTRSLEAPYAPLATVFVQIQNMGPIQIVQHTAILTLLLQRYFPHWSEETAWLSRFMESEARHDGLSNDRFNLRFRKTGVGVFVDISLS